MFEAGTASVHGRTDAAEPSGGKLLNQNTTLVVLPVANLALVTSEFIAGLEGARPK